MSRTTSMISFFPVTLRKMLSLSGFAAMITGLSICRIEMAASSTDLLAVAVKAKYMNIRWYKASELSKTQVVKSEALAPLLNAVCLVYDKSNYFTLKRLCQEHFSYSHSVKQILGGQENQLMKAIFHSLQCLSIILNFAQKFSSDASGQKSRLLINHQGGQWAYNYSHRRWHRVPNRIRLAKGRK